VSGNIGGGIENIWNSGGSSFHGRVEVQDGIMISLKTWA